MNSHPSFGARAVAMDVTCPEAVTRVLHAALGEGGRLPGVVNRVGTILLKPAHLTSDEEWRSALDLNLTSSFLLLREAARRRMASGGGSDVFSSTVAAARGLFIMRRLPPRRPGSRA